MRKPGSVASVKKFPYVQLLSKKLSQETLLHKLVLLLIVGVNAGVRSKNNFFAPAGYVIVEGRRQPVLVFKMFKANHTFERFVNLDPKHPFVPMTDPKHSRLIGLKNVTA